MFAEEKGQGENTKEEEEHKAYMKKQEELGTIAYANGYDACAHDCLEERDGGLQHGAARARRGGR